MAAERGHTKIVDYIVSKGADLDSQDKNGVTICDYTYGSVMFSLEFELPTYISN